MRITLKISSMQESSRQFWLDRGQATVVGRTESAEFVVPDDFQMSGVHFSVSWVDGEFRIRDLNSTNGTTLNGQRILEAALHDGDEVVAGRTQFKVSIEAPANTGSVTAPPATTVNKTIPDLANFATRLGGAIDSEDTPRSPDKHSLPSDRQPGVESILLAKPLIEESAVETVTALADDEEEVDEIPAELLHVVNETPFDVATMPWENADGKCRLTIVLKATFTIATDGNVKIADEQLPVLFGDQHFDDDPLAPIRFESELVPFKPRADIVLVGQAYAPKGRPVTQLDVQLRVGNLRNTIRVFGDRHWEFPSRLAMIPRISKPQPFTKMELTYQRAFGGIDAASARYCAENLAGIGFVGELSPKSMHDKPLPNLEDPQDLIHTWNSRPKPVGFGFYGRGWMPRLGYAGTFDDNYRQNRAPKSPENASYAFYNGAHPDLQVSGYLGGNEDVELKNLTPEGVIRFRLPNLQPIVEVTRYKQTGPPERSRPLLDTLVFVPDERRFYLVFRVVFSLPSLDAVDVERVRVTM
jgi:pSer/pThr/pTyr-binding forkhead associated (FHA) protein